MIEAIEKLRENTGPDSIFRGIADEIEAEIVEKYMELPVDAEGVPIHVGDKVQFREDSPVRVDSIGNSRCYKGDWGFFGGNGGFYGQGTLNSVHHVKPRTIEDVLSDLADEVWNASIGCQTTWSDCGLDGIYGRYADEIRKITEIGKRGYGAIAE